LMELADLLLVKPKLATPMGPTGVFGGNAIGSGSGVTVNVQFIKADTPPLSLRDSSDVTIVEGEAK
jgi:hypothetical protein